MKDMEQLATETPLVPTEVTPPSLREISEDWSIPNFDTTALELKSDSADKRLHVERHHSPLNHDSPKVYADKEYLCIEDQAPLPIGYCIVTNEIADRTVRIPLRDPNNPGTWWGKRPTLRVGISAKTARRILNRKALTWSLLAAGLGLVAFGVSGTFTGFPVKITLASYGIGAILSTISGYFRASASISASKIGRAYTVIQGAHPDFLKKFDQYSAPAERV